MPRRCAVDPLYAALLRGSDWVVSRSAAESWGLTAGSIRHRVRSGQWQELMPGVWLAHPGAPTRRQLLLAALHWAGDTAAVDGVDACRYHGLRAVSVEADDPVHVVVRHGEPARSRRFVVVRRTLTPFRVVADDRLRFVEPATAVVAATRRMRAPRSVLGVASDAIQRRIASYDDLLRAHLQGPPVNARLLDEALADLADGAESVGEVDLKRIVSVSAVLPAPSYNAWVELPDGDVMCLDALWDDAGLVQETNGAVAHRRDDRFDDTLQRQARIVAAGLTLLPNTPRQLRARPRLVLAQIERCYLRDKGRGLPPGVRRVDPPTGLAAWRC